MAESIADLILVAPEIRSGEPDGKRHRQLGTAYLENRCD
jgi:hypothetical protein